MATGNQNQIEVSKDVRKQLALAVRSIQWSYAIFWSISSTQPGVLEWGDGCYNGDIKTRKTSQAAGLNADELGLQRSGQLRELYESLSHREMNPQAKRPTASLSPEDLTDAEWYFLVCMSLVFDFDQGLPGKALSKNRTIWLCNPHLADAKLFSRSLLAKNASIQTIVCFPHLGGVIELGATKLVPEDPNLIQHVIASFLYSPSTAVPHNPIDLPNILDNYKNDPENMPGDSLDRLLDCSDINLPQHVIASFLDSPSTAVPHNPSDLPNILDNYKNDLDNMPGDSLDRLLDGSDIDISSPNNSSNDCANRLPQHVIASFLDSPSTAVPHNPIDPPNILDNYKNDLENMPGDSLDRLLDCSDIDISSPNNSSNDFVNNLLRDESNEVQDRASELQNWQFLDGDISNCLNNSANLSNCGSQTYGGLGEDARLERNQVHRNNDWHYRNVLLNVLKSSHQLILGPYIRKGGCQSSFVWWKKDEFAMARPVQSGKSQKLLKKLLFEVAKMHENHRVESVQNRNDGPRPEMGENDRNHVVSKRKHRGKINERLSVPGSLVPSDDTHMGGLQRKVEELESYKASIELNSPTPTKRQAAAERISDNYCRIKVGNSKKPSKIKRKASVTKITGAREKKGARLKDSSTDDITINITDEDVWIEIRRPWKDCVLVEIMAAVSRLSMDTQNVQSSNTDGILSLTIKAKCKGRRATSASVIRQALQKIIEKC